MRHDRGVRSTPAALSQSPGESPAGVHIWSGEQFAARVDEAMRIYARAMNYPYSAADQRAVTARRHAHNAGFASRAALLPDGTLVGFGYGYTTAPGQWWHDLVRKALTAPLAAEWLHDAFELSELHVLPEYQGHGIGSALLRRMESMLELENESRVLLETPADNVRAVRFYERQGYLILALKPDGRHLVGPMTSVRLEKRLIPFRGPVPDVD